MRQAISHTNAYVRAHPNAQLAHKVSSASSSAITTDITTNALAKNYMTEIEFGRDRILSKIPHFSECIDKIEANLQSKGNLFYWQIKCYGRNFSIDVRALGKEPCNTIRLAMKKLYRSLRKSSIGIPVGLSRTMLTRDERLLHKKIIDIEPMEGNDLYEDMALIEDAANTQALAVS